MNRGFMSFEAQLSSAKIALALLLLVTFPKKSLTQGDSSDWRALITIGEFF
jgi:hypothetical protein